MCRNSQKCSECAANKVALMQLLLLKMRFDLLCLPFNNQHKLEFYSKNNMHL